jgi:hypothetical protein
MGLLVNGKSPPSFPDAASGRKRNIAEIIKKVLTFSGKLLKIFDAIS